MITAKKACWTDDGPPGEAQAPAVAKTAGEEVGIAGGNHHLTNIAATIIESETETPRTKAGQPGGIYSRKIERKDEETLPAVGGPCLKLRDEIRTGKSGTRIRGHRTIKITSPIG